MDRRERYEDPVEAMRAAMEGKQAEMWTSLPGIVTGFDPAAMTVTVQPAIKGQITDEQGETKPCNLPLLPDVPVCFPCGGGFTLTHPVKAGDACLVVFGSRCIDGWWQHGEVGERPDERMHDLSDGFAIVGPRAKAKTLSPPVDTENVQLRTDDGKAHITMKPDYTIQAENPAAKITMSPAGEVQVTGDQQIILDTPLLLLRVGQMAVAPRVGGATPEAEFQTNARWIGNIDQTGSHTSTGDQIAGGVSQVHHTHKNVQSGGGNSGEPNAG